MSLKTLFTELAGVFNGDRSIEENARNALLAADTDTANLPDTAAPLPATLQTVMRAPDAHPICHTILQVPFEWAPPQSSSSALYAKHSLCKYHVELLGPDGLVKSNKVRLGLYSMIEHSEYGIRTHPAEEIYIMLAGQCDWLRGDMPYTAHGANEKSYHPSMMPHASRTRNLPFMSVYSWDGDLSTENYIYAGLPQE